MDVYYNEQLLGTITTVYVGQVPFTLLTSIHNASASEGLLFLLCLVWTLKYLGYF